MIPKKNIYHMLAYAYQVLQESQYRNMQQEEFENVADLLSAILVKGVNSQIKRGLLKEYKEVKETMSLIRGKIDVTESVKNMAPMKQALVCVYDEYSVDAYRNRIIKTTLELLLKYDISKKRKKEIRNLLLYFKDVGVLDWKQISWKQHYNKNNRTYQMLIAVCHMIITGLLQTQEDGTVRMMDYFDEQRMCRLYEKFILGYYKTHFKDIEVASREIPWAAEGEELFLLPTMQSDIMLTKDDKILIIDAKYYAHTMQSYYETRKLHSGNLYQIFTYVKNKEQESPEKEVSGMLLYAKTEEEIPPDSCYRMSGNKICIRTLDLNKDFVDIRKTLDEIAQEFFYRSNLEVNANS